MRIRVPVGLGLRSLPRNERDGVILSLRHDVPPAVSVSGRRLLVVFLPPILPFVMSWRRYPFLGDDLLLRLPYLEQVIEEGAVMHDRFAQLLSICRPLLITHSNGLRRSIIRDNIRVID